VKEEPLQVSSPVDGQELEVALAAKGMRSTSPPRIHFRSKYLVPHVMNTAGAMGSSTGTCVELPHFVVAVQVTAARTITLECKTITSLMVVTCAGAAQSSAVVARVLDRAGARGLAQMS
jgi:hypothetical protein